MSMDMTLLIFMRMFMTMSVQIFHIMVMILMFFIQHNIKIAGINSRFHHSADLRLKS